jgi:hypothetical protein
MGSWTQTLEIRRLGGAPNFQGDDETAEAFAERQEANRIADATPPAPPEGFTAGTEA